jgi:hypothetical protein
VAKDMEERAEAARSENEGTEEQRLARDISKAQEGSEAIRRTAPLEKLDEGDLSEYDEEQLRG